MDGHPNPMLVCLYANKPPGDGLNKFSGVSFSVRNAHGKHPHAVVYLTHDFIGEIVLCAIEADIYHRFDQEVPIEWRYAA